MEAKQTPLIELLERVPQDARVVVEHDQFSSSSHPVGRLCHEAAAALRAALAQEQAEPVQEPVAWIYQNAYTEQEYLVWKQGNGGRNWTPLYTAPPRCPNCASLEAQNDELDRKLAEMERAHGIIEPQIKVDSHQTLDDAMRLPRAMAQAYENGYRAGAAAERKRIIQFLTEMQRQVGDGHNHYGVAAMRIRERI